MPIMFSTYKISQLIFYSSYFTIFINSNWVEEIISEDEFIREYNLYKQKTKELKDKLDRLEEGKKSYNSKNDVEKLIIEFSETKKFDNKILKKLVEKIEIGKNEEVNIILKV